MKCGFSASVRSVSDASSTSTARTWSRSSAGGSAGLGDEQGSIGVLDGLVEKGGGRRRGVGGRREREGGGEPVAQRRLLAMDGDRGKDRRRGELELLHRQLVRREPREQLEEH